MSCAAADNFIMHTALRSYMAETRRKDTSTFNWTFPLDIHHKIANIKCYRTFHGCTLGEAKTAVETAMEASQQLTIDNLMV